MRNSKSIAIQLTGSSPSHAKTRGIGHWYRDIPHMLHFLMSSALCMNCNPARTATVLVEEAGTPAGDSGRTGEGARIREGLAAWRHGPAAYRPPTSPLHGSSPSPAPPSALVRRGMAAIAVSTLLPPP
jgi:hypothetical protein